VDGVSFRYVDIETLIEMKEKAGRPVDLEDARQLRMIANDPRRTLTAIPRRRAVSARSLSTAPLAVFLLSAVEPARLLPSAAKPQPRGKPRVSANGRQLPES
jgi:hypothetical protein